LCEKTHTLTHFNLRFEHLQQLDLPRLSIMDRQLYTVTGDARWFQPFPIDPSPVNKWLVARPEIMRCPLYCHKMTGVGWPLTTHRITASV